MHYVTNNTDEQFLCLESLDPNQTISDIKLKELLEKRIQLLEL